MKGKLTDKGRGSTNTNRALRFPNRFDDVTVLTAVTFVNIRRPKCTADVDKVASLQHTTAVSEVHTLNRHARTHERTAGMGIK